MTTELGKILTDFVSCVDDWNSRMIHTEEDLLKRLEGLNRRLSDELPKQRIQTIQEYSKKKLPRK